MATSSSHLFTNPSDADIIRNFQPEYDTSSQLDDAEDTFQTPDTKEPSNVNEYSARLLLWLVCLITFVDVALLPAVSISTLVPIAGLFAFPLIALLLITLFYSVPTLAYLLLAQTDPPTHARTPYLPPLLQNPKHCYRINLAVYRWLKRALIVASRMLTDLLKWKIINIGGNAYVRENIVYSKGHSEKRLDVYSPFIVRNPSLFISGSPPSPFTPTSAFPSAASSLLRPIIIFLAPPQLGPVLSRKWMFNALGRDLSALSGYCVIIPDLTVYGNNLVTKGGDALNPKGRNADPPKNAGYQGGSRIKESCEDLRRVLRWAWDNGYKYGGDRKRIYLMGHALGAHLALLQSIQQAVVISRDDYLRSSTSDAQTISNGVKRVEIYGERIWVPKIEGMVLLSPICDVEKQVLSERKTGISHLSTVRRSLGPTHLPCIFHSPSHLLHAARNVVQPDLLPQKVLFMHGGLDNVVHWSQSENMKELMRGVGVADSRVRIYATGHTGILTSLMLDMSTPLSQHISEELRSFIRLERMYL